MPANDDRTTTIRLALVLNGGISLAVWMGGVVRELDIARRASLNQPLPASDGDPSRRAAEERHHEFWRSRFAEQNAVLEVDIVAGTSAGGLNGALLATSIGTGAVLQDLRPMWRASAALRPDALLRENGPDPTDSVLDGAFFERRVTDEVGRMTARAQPALGSDVTLFVTATALDGEDPEYLDSRGRRFTAADHRCVYRFARTDGETTFDAEQAAFRTTPVNDFVDSSDDLVRAARASAGFPVAFPPVAETPGLVALAQRRPRGEPHWLVDGGVLDNAPIGPVLDEVTKRPLAGRRVRRYVAYVAPSNGVAARRPPRDARAPVWTGVLGSALGFPKESDFRQDVAQLEELSVRAALARDGMQASFVMAMAGSGDLVSAAAGGLYGRYRRARGAKTGLEVRRAVARASGVPVTFGARAPDPEELDGTTTDTGSGWLPETLPLDEPWGLGLDATLRATRLLTDRIREQHVDVADDLCAVVARLTALRSVFMTRLVGLARRGEAGGAAAVLAEEGAVDVLVAATYDDLTVRSVLEAQCVDAVRIYAEATGADPSLVRRALVSAEVSTQALSPMIDAVPPPPFSFLRIGPDTGSPLAGAEQALDGRPLGELGEDKLYGTRLGHFGAFGREEWRDHDWTWGRMDGAAHIAGALGLGEDRIAEVQELAAAAEGVGRDEVVRGLHAVDAMGGDGAVLEALASEGDLFADVTDAVVRVLGQTDDRLPGPVRSRGPWLQTVLQIRGGPRPGLGQRVARAFAQRRIRAFLAGLGKRS